jgi:hypothetical protein
MAFPLTFGRRPKDANDKSFDYILKPGEETEVTLNNDQYSKLRGILKNRSYDKVSSVRLFLEEAAFDDDLMWNGGDLLRRDPSEPNRWLHIK